MHDPDSRILARRAVASLALSGAILLVAACGDGDSSGPGDPGDPRFPDVPPGTVVFLDDVDSENGGEAVANYTGWSKWNVVAGCVDLHGPGEVDPLPGNGLYADLDGSCASAGTLESKAELNLGPGDYVLEFIMAGNNQAAGSDAMTITVGPAFQAEVVLDWQEPFELRTHRFTVSSATSGRIRLAHAGGDDQGILIDAVRLREE